MIPCPTAELDELIRDVVETHLAPWGAHIRHTVCYTDTGLLLELHYHHPTGPAYAVSDYFGCKGLTHPQYEEYVHCGTHGLVANAMRRWDLWSRIPPP